MAATSPALSATILIDPDAGHDGYEDACRLNPGRYVKVFGTSSDDPAQLTGSSATAPANQTSPHGGLHGPVRGT